MCFFLTFLQIQIGDTIIGDINNRRIQLSKIGICYFFIAMAKTFADYRHWNAAFFCYRCPGMARDIGSERYRKIEIFR